MKLYGCELGHSSADSRRGCTLLAQDTSDANIAAGAIEERYFSANEMLPGHVATRLMSLKTHLVAAASITKPGNASLAEASQQQAASDAAALARFTHLPMVATDLACTCRSSVAMRKALSCCAAVRPSSPTSRS